MIRIFVLHNCAEGRNQLVRRLRELATENPSKLELLPRLEYRPIALGELKYSQQPDLCIIGSRMALDSPSSIGDVKKILKTVPVVVALEAEDSDLRIVDRLLRQGADDTVSLTVSSNDFLARLITLTRKAPQTQGGKTIIIDSGKGGLGTTSITAALGDLMHRAGKEVCLIDCDFRSQDLSRFLQAAPFINSQLQNMLEGVRPVTEEFLSQSLVNVWMGERNVWLMPPPPENDDLLDPRSNYSRIFTSVLDLLAQQVDFIIIDIGPLIGPMQRAIYKAANIVCYVVDNDPGSIYASVDQIETQSYLLAPTAEVLLIENKNSRYGIKSSTLRRQLETIISRPGATWAGEAIPFCPAGSRWPASGQSLFSLGSIKTKSACKSISNRLLGKKQEQRSLYQYFNSNRLSNALNILGSRKARKQKETIECSPKLQLVAKSKTLALPHTDLQPVAERNTKTPEAANLEEHQTNVSELVTAPSVVAL